MSETASKQLPRLKDRLETICMEMIEKGILYSEAVEHFEKCFIAEVVRRNQNNLTRAAADLGIHRNTLAKRMNHYQAKHLRK